MNLESEYPWRNSVAFHLFFPQLVAISQCQKRHIFFWSSVLLSSLCICFLSHSPPTCHLYKNFSSTVHSNQREIVRKGKNALQNYISFFFLFFRQDVEYLVFWLITTYLLKSCEVALIGQWLSTSWCTLIKQGLFFKANIIQSLPSSFQLHSLACDGLFRFFSPQTKLQPQLCSSCY